ncbi:hypothetical protein COO60DRAFT_865571 [Scenedesmus sp. NREL 46B-D3]|nr:hypothetical protein COO60DRAFT_865571 [Scenedesmus sp. NREL 46B-D3]
MHHMGERWVARLVRGELLLSSTYAVYCILVPCPLTYANSVNCAGMVSRGRKLARCMHSALCGFQCGLQHCCKSPARLAGLRRDGVILSKHALNRAKLSTLSECGSLFSACTRHGGRLSCSWWLRRKPACRFPVKLAALSLQGGGRTSLLVAGLGIVGEYRLRPDVYCCCTFGGPRHSVVCVNCAALLVHCSSQRVLGLWYCCLVFHVLLPQV